MKMHEVIVPQGFERYSVLWNDPHYLSSFSLGVRVVAGFLMTPRELLRFRHDVPGVSVRKLSISGTCFSAR